MSISSASVEEDDWSWKSVSVSIPNDSSLANFVKEIHLHSSLSEVLRKVVTTSVEGVGANQAWWKILYMHWIPTSFSHWNQFIYDQLSVYQYCAKVKYLPMHSIDNCMNGNRFSSQGCCLTVMWKRCRDGALPICWPLHHPPSLHIFWHAILHLFTFLSSCFYIPLMLIFITATPNLSLRRVFFQVTKCTSSHNPRTGNSIVNIVLVPSMYK